MYWWCLEPMMEIYRLKKGVNNWIPIQVCLGNRNLGPIYPSTPPRCGELHWLAQQSFNLLHFLTADIIMFKKNLSTDFYQCEVRM